jgi:insertion element IS1 protein InsB
LISVNQPLLSTLSPDDVEVMIRRAGEAEVDEMWSYVKRKTEPRWLWHVIDHRSGKVLAYVFGCRQDEVFLKLKAYWSHLAFRTITRTIVVHTGVIFWSA